MGNLRHKAVDLSPKGRGASRGGQLVICWALTVCLLGGLVASRRRSSSFLGRDRLDVALMR